MMNDPIQASGRDEDFKIEVLLYESEERQPLWMWRCLQLGCTGAGSNYPFESNAWVLGRAHAQRMHGTPPRSFLQREEWENIRKAMGLDEQGRVPWVALREKCENIIANQERENFNKYDAMMAIGQAVWDTLRP